MIPSLQLNISVPETLNLNFDITQFSKQVCAEKKIQSGSIDITLVDNPTIIEINKKHLNRTYPTDTISFNLSSDDEDLTGDIYISYEQVEKNAAEYHTSFEEELKLVIIHSILHLLDYRDYTDAEKRHMSAEQNRILKRLK